MSNNLRVNIQTEAQLVGGINGKQTRTWMSSVVASVFPGGF